MNNICLQNTTDFLFCIFRTLTVDNEYDFNEVESYICCSLHITIIILWYEIYPGHVLTLYLFRLYTKNIAIGKYYFSYFRNINIVD